MDDEQARQARADRLMQALEGSGLALWDYDARTARVLMSEAWAAMRGEPLAPSAGESVEGRIAAELREGAFEQARLGLPYGSVIDERQTIEASETGAALLRQPCRFWKRQVFQHLRNADVERIDVSPVRRLIGARPAAV